MVGGVLRLRPTKRGTPRPERRPHCRDVAMGERHQRIIPGAAGAGIEIASTL